MTKKTAKKTSRFGTFMRIYLVVMLAVIGIGLWFFWNFIEAFELSRPQHAIDNYIAQLTEEHICDLSQEVLAQVDLNLQKEEECRSYLMSQLDEITYRKNPSESTDTQTVYTLRSGTRIIGRVTMTPYKTDKFGFDHWSMAEETFDLGYMINHEQIRITVPDDFVVSVNGNPLDASYQVETGIQYDLMEEFYDDYELPSMVTYAAGPFLGQMDFVVTDSSGNAVVIDENTDYNQFIIDNCDEQKRGELKDFMDEYIKNLVGFTSSKRANVRQNYYKLQKYLVKGGDLDKRMYGAIGTYEYSHNQKDVIADIKLHHCIDIGNDRYLCDLTYLVDTTGREGVVQTTNNVKVIAVETDSGLRVEAMTSY